MNPPNSFLVTLALLSALLFSGCASQPMPRGIAGATAAPASIPAAAHAPAQIATMLSTS
jgi:PBP1b-binding outer membrane lipoprotein LpoB